ncbi:thiolase family protein [Bombilactobacillus thymidiniphilus]|uniref:acetyl-CoA C-acetyltransferase n=1 Tax=Bombilactobacillus thymidiniphilus TaxID=2923363 RepID=A0ABY4PBW3_9LACO|nr:thiolase family protein [Bombilactobacillus thymidiniphilus]UQS83255.1 thiolase family protein [Bombilactobacillus thymidiniphilus]
MKTNEIVIVAAKRSATGKFRGSLSRLTAVELATKLVTEMLAQTKITPTMIDQVILGNVLSTGLGQNIARQVQVKAGLPVTGTAMTINQVCGSGLKAVRLGQTALMLDDAQVVLAGGVESMSNAPAFAARKDKKAFALDDFQDTLFYDGLNDAFGGYAMGVTAENLNRKFNLDRVQLDQYALLSQKKATQAQQNGFLTEEIVPINGLAYDEVVRSNTTLDKLATLKPVYQEHGLVTAGNSSPLSDGASIVALTTSQTAQEQGLKPLATIKGFSEVGYQPELMGYTPVLAIQKLLQTQQQTVADIDWFEVNEAFASQALVVQQELQIDSAKYNPLGGALALGHALGSSGARILTTLVHNLKRTKQKTGIAALCIGGGQAVAMEVENCEV